VSTTSTTPGPSPRGPYAWTISPTAQRKRRRAGDPLHVTGHYTAGQTTWDLTWHPDPTRMLAIQVEEHVCLGGACAKPRDLVKDYQQPVAVAHGLKEVPAGAVGRALKAYRRSLRERRAWTVHITW